MNHSILIIIIFCSSAFACDTAELKEGSSDCLKQKIAEFEHGDFGKEKGAKVLRYKFQGHYIYVFDSGQCCDMISPVYDEDCVEICGLGGIAGNMTCNGESFDKATDETLIWENK